MSCIDMNKSNRQSDNRWKRTLISLSSAGKSAFALDLDLTLFSHRIIYEETQQTGFYEKDISFLMISLLKPGDMVIDVGAHIGYFTLLAGSLVEESGRVFSFEPIEENRKRLMHQVGINGLTNAILYPDVVGDQNGKTTFFYNEDNDGGHAIWDVSRHPFNEKTKRAPRLLSLPIVRLDDFFNPDALSKLKMIKIDTEGNELNVLAGARHLIDTHRVKCIACELNRYGLKQMGHSERQLRGFMYDLDYETLAYFNDRLRVLTPDQYLKADAVLNLFFMPKEFIQGFRSPEHQCTGYHRKNQEN
ncbi:MAG: FkbM family methyltransferase [Desulfobacteraceae bacterium]|nr:MAG: FkbM family methyltransferase [Desulfobacteraceae bacterium]